jgi:hypothetical protein
MWSIWEKRVDYIQLSGSKLVDGNLMRYQRINENLML